MASTTEQALKARRWRQLVNSLSQMRTVEKADVILVCGLLQFPVHKVVLEASSPYFGALFSGEFQDGKTVSEHIAFMETNPETLAAILDFIYLGDVSQIKTEERLKAVARASRILMLDELRQYCCDALVAFLTTDNFFEIFELNWKLGTKNIKLKVLYFWIANATKLVASDEFLKLSAECVKALLNFLRSNHSRLNVVLVGLLRWLTHDMEARKLFVDELFACIDARLVNKECVNYLAQNPSVLNASAKLADKVSKLGAVSLGPGVPSVRFSALTSTPVRPWARTISYFSDYRIISVFNPSQTRYFDTTEKFMCVQQLDLSNMTWLPSKTNTVFQSCNSWGYIPMCQYDQSVCMIGGMLGLNGIYNLQSNVFKAARSVVFSGGPNTKMCSFKGRLYTIGENETNKMINMVHCATPGSSFDWRQVQPLNYYHSVARVLASSDYIYIIGEMTEGGMVIEYNSDPAEKHEWDVIHIEKSGLDPNYFFVADNRLQGLYFQESLIKHLVYDHETKRFIVKGIFHAALHKSVTTFMKLSHFQNSDTSLVFFSKLEDPLCIPAYVWDSVTDKWDILPALEGQCCIPTQTYIKVLYAL